jgi:hypothetical protein
MNAFISPMRDVNGVRGARGAENRSRGSEPNGTPRIVLASSIGYVVPVKHDRRVGSISNTFSQ